MRMYLMGISFDALYFVTSFIWAWLLVDVCISCGLSRLGKGVEWNNRTVEVTDVSRKEYASLCREEMSL